MQYIYIHLYLSYMGYIYGLYMEFNRVGATRSSVDVIVFSMKT